MKKYISIISILLLLAIISGCNNNLGEKAHKGRSAEKVATDKQVTTNTNKDSIDTNASKDSELLIDPFIGEWHTTKRLIIPNVYSEEELKENDMVGHKVIIKQDFFSEGNIRYLKPYYKMTVISDNEFVGENIGTFSNSKLGKLKIRKNSQITKLDVYSNKSMDMDSLIETFYLEDKNTLITNSDFIAFFELKRSSIN